MVSRSLLLCERASLNLMRALSNRFSKIRILWAGEPSRYSREVECVAGRASYPSPPDLSDPCLLMVWGNIDTYCLLIMF